MKSMLTQETLDKYHFAISYLAHQIINHLQYDPNLAKAAKARN